MSHLDKEADIARGCVTRSALLTADKASLQSCVHHPARKMSSLGESSMGDAVLENKLYADRRKQPREVSTKKTE